ncbi:small integral membrane protein 28-like, partial [Acipenser oxyrinchus oxyrinchus]
SMWLLESSWMKFGHAGRGTYDWVTGVPPPLVRKQLQSRHWNEYTSSNHSDTEVIFYIVLPTATLLLIGIIVFLIYQRCTRKKASPQNIVTVDFQGSDQQAEFLSSLNGDNKPFLSTSEDLSEGVFLMVCLPPLYEETIIKTLTKQH